MVEVSGAPDIPFSVNRCSSYSSHRKCLGSVKPPIIHHCCLFVVGCTESFFTGGVQNIGKKDKKDKEKKSGGTMKVIRGFV